jgi:hypothetical protein
MYLTEKKLREGTYLEKGTEFISSSVFGKWVDGSDSWGLATGKLPLEYRKVLHWQMQKNPDTKFYIVFSYFTPIAWTWINGHDEWFIPPVAYSATTTKHQKIVRQAARSTREVTEEEWEAWIKLTQ